MTAEENKIVDMISGVYERVQNISLMIKNGNADQSVLNALGQMMEAAAEAMQNGLQSDRWTNYYQCLEEGKIPENFEDVIREWSYDIQIWYSQKKKSVGRCPLCGKSVSYLPNNGYFTRQKKTHKFPYWNAGMESISEEKRSCPECGALDRERMMALFIQMLQPAEDERLKVLQIAPAKALEDWLIQQPDIDYESTDLMMEGVTFQSDIQDMKMVSDGTYDLVICSHILEHVKDDRKAMREIRRIMKPEGVCLFLVPLITGLSKTDEEWGLSPEENWKRFGQDDHVRLYAKKDFLDRLTESGFLVHILGKRYFDKEQWTAAGLTDNHFLYVATWKDIGIGVPPYVPNTENKQKLVSVIIPTHNRAYCIERSINSVLNQTYQNLELIVVDDASTDKTSEIIETIDDLRLKYIKLQECKGANHARNVGIQASNGEYIAFNDSDDEWSPDKLAKQMALMELEQSVDDSHIAGVYCGLTRYRNNEIVGVAPILAQQTLDHLNGNLYDYMLTHMFMSTQTVVLKKSVLDEVGYFNENLNRLQDWELFLRISHDFDFRLVQESLVKVYESKDSISKNDQAFIETVLYVKNLHEIWNDILKYNRYVDWIVTMAKQQEFPEAFQKNIMKNLEADKVLSNYQLECVRRALGGHNNQITTVQVIENLTQKCQKLEKEVRDLRTYILSRPETQREAVRWINRDRVDYEIETFRGKGINTESTRETRIIVSLTSYPERMYDVKYTLYSLVRQSLKPDCIVLWLANEEFPNHEDDISPRLLELMRRWGVTVRWCSNIGSYKKLVPALREFPNDILVTADDDIYYGSEWLRGLVSAWEEKPDYICAYRAHRIQIDTNGEILPYQSWMERKNEVLNTASYLNFLTGGEGALYFPGALDARATDETLFKELASGSDDIWFWAMAVLNHTAVYVPESDYFDVVSTNLDRELGLNGDRRLMTTNVSQNNNDESIKKVLAHFPELYDRLAEESKADQFKSAEYWEKRYQSGGASGAGSYHRLAEFKAKILNQFVKEYNIDTVVEWGCGDGNQLKLANYKNYIGYDVSPKAVEICRGIFKDESKKFQVCTDETQVDSPAELALSLDVIYHLVEDDVFEHYMRRLFDSSKRFVCIYSSNFDQRSAAHVRNRRFTDWIEENEKDWRQIKYVRNQYPYDENDPNNTSWSDFYFYEK